MIAYFKGEINYISDRYIILLVGETGYKVFVNQNLLEKLKKGQDLELHTHLRHREDAFDLFGFLKREELEFFELLITISGVGPRSALGVLEIANLGDIKRAIIKGDPTLLRKVSGIGNKTAERIVVELKNKLEALPQLDEKIDLSDPGSADAFDALVGLGYAERDVRETLKQVPQEVVDMQEKVRIGLKMLGKSR